MIKLDDNLLTELGLQVLPAEDKKALLRHIYETLEMRVGTTLARQMTDGQLDEFEAFINSNDEAGALRWLETNFPNYKDVVAQEFEVLKAEVRQSAPQILASANANAAAAMTAQPQMAAEIQPQQNMPQPQQMEQMAAPQQFQQYQQPSMQQAPQQPVYSTPAPQAPIATQPAMPQQDYAAPQQFQQMAAQPQPAAQQFDPIAQQQPTYAPQYPQPVTPQQYQQPMPQPGIGMPPTQQPQQPTPVQQQPFDQNQFGQAA